MNRRDFLASGTIAASASRPSSALAGTAPSQSEAGYRDLFPRLEREVYLAAAAATPLSTFTEAGLQRYQDYWRYGPGDGRAESVREMFAETRSVLARLLGADDGEIAFVHCTKEGEQIVLNGLPALRKGGNVVTNDLHFGGSLRNLLGQAAKGLDVRVVPTVDWRTDPMASYRDNSFRGRARPQVC